MLRICEVLKNIYRKTRQLELGHSENLFAKNIKRTIRSSRHVFYVSVMISFIFINPSFAHTNVGGDITKDSTWTYAGSPYTVTSDVRVYGTDGPDSVTVLTIEPGVVVKFQPNRQLKIGTTSSPGGLLAVGTTTKPITFTATDTLDHWYYIYFDKYSADLLCSLRYCNIKYGGKDKGNIYSNSASPTIEHCSISRSNNSGIYLASSSPYILSDSISRNDGYGIQCADTGSYPIICGNNISNNGSSPIKIYPNSVGNICSDNTYSGNVKNYVEVAGGTIKLDATWHPQTVPYLITSNVAVCDTDGSDKVTVLTIEPRSVLKFNSGVSLVIGSVNPPYFGGLMAIGTANDSIVFTASDTIAGWGYIHFNTNNIDSVSSLKYCNISYGGLSYGNIYCTSASPTIENCSIFRSKKAGIYLAYSSPEILSNSILRDSTYGIQCADTGSYPIICGNDILNNGSYPIRIYPNSVGDICSDNFYSGNDSNYVQIVGGKIERDVTWHPQGISYLISSNVTVCGTAGSDNVTVLTIEPGSELKFNSGRSLVIGDPNPPYFGGLIAVGTANDSIIFTALDTIQGWAYIQFNTYNVDSLCSLKYCQVTYGGSSYGNIYCKSAFPPTIEHCSISHSKNAGLYLDSSSPNILNNSISTNKTYGIECANTASRPTVCGNDISDNNSYPIQIYANSVSGICSTNTYSGNWKNEIKVVGERITLDATWHKQSIPYFISSSVSVYGTDGADSVTVLTIQPRSVLEFNSGTNLTIGSNSSPYVGGLMAVGTPTDTILFTTADTVQRWSYLKFDQYSRSSVCVLKYCEVSYASNYNIYCNSASPKIQQCSITNSKYDGIYLDKSSPEIDCNLITANQRYGIYCTQSNPLIHGNQIFDNTQYGVYNATNTITVDADSNYWGDTSGPYDPDSLGSCKTDYNPSGKGDKVSDCVKYRPWSEYESQPLSVTSPNGGVLWCGGDAYMIRWTSSNIDTVKIEYSTNGGKDWNIIVSKTPSDGNYVWTVPDSIKSNSCFVKVCEIDEIPCDMSDSAFTILPVLAPPNLVWPACGTAGERIDPTYFDWSPSADANFYRLQIDNDPGFSSPDYDSSGITSTSQNIYGLLLGTTYYWRVSAYDTCGPSDWSPVWYFTTSSHSVTLANKYWVPYVDTIHFGHSVTYNELRIYGLENITLIQIDTASFYLYAGESKIINRPQLREGLLITSDKPLQVSYHFAAGDFGLYDDGSLAYSILEESCLGNEYFIPTPNTEVSILSTQNNTFVSVGSVNYNLNAGQTKRLATVPVGTHISSNHPIMVVAVNYTSDLLGSTYAYQMYPTTALDTVYYSPKQHPYNYSSASDDSRLYILAVQNATSVMVGSDVFQLDRGDSAVRLCTNEEIISSNKPVYAIFLSDIYARDPWGGGVYRHYEFALELLPSNVGVTKAFVPAPYAPPSHGFPVIQVCVTSLADGNRLTISTNDAPGKTVYLNRGERAYYHEREIEGWDPEPLQIQAHGLIQATVSTRGWWSGISEGASGFTISGLGLTVTSPNGGEIWSAGGKDTIRWASTNVDTVEIDYTTDGGSNWIPITPKTPSDGSYPWTVPNTSSTSCLVRICDKDNSPCDQSDSFFTITVEKVTVTSPNGGEKWCSGDIETVTWSATDVDSVRIYYSTDGGRTWTLIVQLPSTQSYAWPVPAIISDSCLVKVCDIYGSPCDQSDTLFSISKENLTVTSPNGGEGWLVESSQNITWKSNCISNVNISYSTNGGSNWSNVAQNTPSDGSYTWTIPNTPSDTCLIKICDVEGSSLCDTSDSPFTITRQSITLKSPNGDEDWCANDTNKIEWNSTFVDSVKILCSTNNGSNWDTVVSCDTNIGYYYWRVPNTLSTLCRVKVCDCDLNPCDESDSNFTILTIPSPPTLVSPSNGVTNVSVDSTHFVWNASSGANSYWLQVDDDSAFASPEYDSSGIVSTNRNVYGLSCGAKYYWRVKTINICGASGWSEVRRFTTIPASVVIISPNGGEKLCGEQNDTIKWTSFCVSNVKIDLSADSGLNWQTIISNTPSDGNHLWKVPDSSSSNCLIRICDTEETLCDTSNNYFSITAQGITVKFPNGGETFYEEEQDSITWNSQCFLGPVRIEYSTHSGKDWMRIVDSMPNDGHYDWKIPSVDSDSCRIRVSDANDGIPHDESNNNFAIKIPLAALKEYHPNSEEWICYDSCLTLNFSRKMDPTTFNANNISIRGVNGLIYKWSPLTTSDSQSFYICPDSGFYSLDTITVTLKGAIKDSLARCWDVNEDGAKNDCSLSKSWKFYIYPLGDYNKDKMVNGDDVADFTIAWNEQDTSEEIGPATGTPPHLLPSPDGKIDFEDLVIFVWMWNWFHQSSYPSPSIYLGDERGDFDNLIAFTPDSTLTKNATKEFGLTFTELEDAMAVSLVLQYDPGVLQIESASEGYLWSKDGAKVLFLKSIDNQRGITEIALSRLIRYGVGVSSTEPVAKVVMKAVSEISSEPVIMQYKIWKSNGEMSASGRSVVRLNSEESAPSSYQLFQNFPNPFNAVTQIKYALPKDCQVKLAIYNTLGQKVKTLVDGRQSRGFKNISWNGTDETGKEMSSGIYFLRIETDEFVGINKMVILK